MIRFAGETRQGSRKKNLIFLLALPIVAFVVVFVLYLPEFPMDLRWPIFIGLSTGLLLAVLIWGIRSYPRVSRSMLSPLMVALKQVEPDDLLITERFVVARKSDVYIGLPDSCSALYFIRFHRPKERSSMGMKLPRLAPASTLSLIRYIRSPGYLVKVIDDVPVARIEGEFKIPVSALQTGDNRYVVKYVEGPGLLYLVRRYRRGSGVKGMPVDVFERIKRDMILSMIEELSREPA